jgi:hypothetical protein
VVAVRGAAAALQLLAPANRDLALDDLLDHVARRGPSVGQAAASMSDPTATGPNVQMGQPWRLSSDDAAGLRDVVGAVTSEQRQAQRGTGFSARL